MRKYKIDNLLSAVLVGIGVVLLVLLLLKVYAVPTPPQAVAKPGQAVPGAAKPASAVVGGQLAAPVDTQTLNQRGARVCRDAAASAGKAACQ